MKMRSLLLLGFAVVDAEASVRLACAKNITQCLDVKNSKLVMVSCLGDGGAIWQWSPGKDIRRSKLRVQDDDICVKASSLEAVDCDGADDSWSWNASSLHVSSGELCLEAAATDGQVSLESCQHIDESKGTGQEQNGYGAISAQAWVLLPARRPQVDLLDDLVFPLRAHQSHIIDSEGKRVKLAGVNWFGAHMEPLVNNGLETAPISRIAKTIKHMGFNSVRLSYAISMHDDSQGNGLPFPQKELQAAIYAANPELKGLNALEVFDKCVEAITNESLLVIINNHMGKAGWCCTGDDGSELWDRESYSKEDWLHSLSFMAARYRNNPRVIGIDLINEPRVREGTNEAPWWGSWPELVQRLNGFHIADLRKAAGEASVAVWRGNPDALTIVEGQIYASNLQFVITRPMKFSQECLFSRVVYESHEYNWFGYLYRIFADTNNYLDPFSIVRDMKDMMGFGTENIHNQTSNAATSGNGIDADLGNQGGDNLLSYSRWKQIQEDALFYLTTKGLAPLWVGEFGTNAKVGSLGYWWRYILRFFKEGDHNWCYWPVDPEKVPRNGKVKGTLLPEGKPDSYGIFDGSVRDYSMVVGWKLQDLISIQAPDPSLPDTLPKPEKCDFDLDSNLESVSADIPVWESFSTLEPAMQTSLALIFLVLLTSFFGVCCFSWWFYQRFVQEPHESYEALREPGAQSPSRKSPICLTCAFASGCAVLIFIFMLFYLPAYGRTQEPPKDILSMQDTLPPTCKPGGFNYRCFGAAGSDCEKVPVIDTCPEGEQAMSVGSLLHDLCCAECKQGVQCDLGNPSKWTIATNFISPIQPCAFEWRKATTNFFNGRYWCVKFNEEERTTLNDVTLSNQTREWEPTLYTGDAYGRRSTYLSVFNAKRADCAPKGTKLDCPDCDSCQGSSCRAALGDSSFCCSGSFSEVEESFGTCS